MAIVPDDKNWTWVLERPCYDCGFRSDSIDIAGLGDRVRELAEPWPELLARPDAALRPTGDQWSALEYACHVRDVFRVYDGRLARMLAEDGPHFENWDQDATAIDERYDLQDPATVAAELAEAAAAIATRWDGVRADQYERTGFRSDGAAFTVESLGKYFVHDPIHHLDDVARGNRILADSQLD